MLPNGATMPVMTISALHIMMCCNPIGVDILMDFLKVVHVGLNEPLSRVRRKSAERNTR